MRKTFPVLTLALAVLAVPSVHSASKSPAAPARASAASGPGQDANAGFDSTKVRKLYQDGDFEQAIAMLESALKEKKVVDHGDSVFVFKHLGVMYAANENTRERGKYFMLQLLTIEPTARIMDMYASDMIYMIFKNIQEEYATTHTKYVRAEKHVAGNQAAETKQEEARPARNEFKNDLKSEPKNEPAVSHTSTYLWIGAATVMIGAGVAVYVLSESQSDKTINYEVK